MNLAPTEITALHAHLETIDRITADIDALGPPIAKAEDAMARQRQRIADLAQEIAALAPARVTHDPSRVDALLAGAEVTYADRKEIETNATKSRLLSSRRDQMVADLDALGHHLGNLQAQINTLRLRQSLIERDLTVQLGDALYAAYRRDITAFVAERMREMVSVADKISTMTGTQPAWRGLIGSGLTVLFPAEDYNRNLPPGHMAKAWTLWPRGDGTLISFDGSPYPGGPCSSPAVVERLIAEIRASATPDAAEVTAAPA